MVEFPKMVELPLVVELPLEAKHKQAKIHRFQRWDWSANTIYMEDVGLVSQARKQMRVAMYAGLCTLKCVKNYTSMG